jgi:hypothetical protein
MKNLTRLAIAALALAPIAGFAQTLAPSQDTYYVPGNGSNFGTAAAITVGSSGSIGLVQFDLTQLPSGLTSAQIQKATLTLFLDHVNTGGSINIDTVSASTPWGELTVTGNSGISQGIAVNTSVMTNTVDTFIALDATAAVQGWITTPGSNNGFMIQANATTSVQFDSKENTTTSHPATLTIVLASVGPTGPTGATGATGAASAVTSVFGRTGAVVGASNDYSFSQLSGSAAAGQLPVIPIANGGLNTSSPAFAALTDGATVTWALAGTLVSSAALTFTAHSGSRTLNITGAVSGGEYKLWLKQDSTGGEGLTLGTGCAWKVSNNGGGAVTPSTFANAVDMLVFTFDGTNCYANFNQAFN